VPDSGPPGDPSEAPVEASAREKITVLNLRHAPSTALVTAHVAGLASQPPGLHVNKMLAAGLDGALGWPGDPAFAALLEEPAPPSPWMR
jgi:hypothetical protein